MIKKKSLEYDLRYIQAALEVLDQYLLSDEVFWPIEVNPPDGESDYPLLTLDGLLLARLRSAAHPISAYQKERVELINSSLDLHRSKWRVAWEKKADQCYRVRVRMWADFLREYQDNLKENVDRYAYEVRLRVMLSLVKLEIGIQNPGEVELLNSLDGYLKKVFVPGGFIWEAEIQGGFPSNEYWYLYGNLPHSVKMSQC